MKTLCIQLKASSITNAIFICLMISIFCGCLVLLSSYQNLLNNKLSLQEELIHRNTSAFNYFISKLEELPFNKETEIDLFDDGIRSYGTRKKWGFNEVLTVRTLFKRDTITTAKFVGVERKTNNIALYLTDYDKPLRTSGNTKIIGNLKIPGGRIEQAYLNGKKGNFIKTNGKQSKSYDRLPKIYGAPYFNTNYKPVLYETLDPKAVTINDFSSATKIIRIDDLKGKDLAIKGNFILKSESPIEISSKSRLNDVMLVAPEVTFKSGFRGNVHTVAKKTVEVEENVHLKYPSSIYIKSDYDSISVRIGKKSSVLGGVIITGDTYQGSLKRHLKIDENATVVGSVYCYGKTELNGEIRGSLYTDKFFLKTESSEYENVLLNGVIDISSLPEGFIGMPVLNATSEKPKYVIIKEL